MKTAGLLEGLNAEYVGYVQPSLSYNPKRDQATLIMNADAIKTFSLQLAEIVSEIAKKSFPIKCLGVIVVFLLGPF